LVSVEDSRSWKSWQTGAIRAQRRLKKKGGITLDAYTEKARVRNSPLSSPHQAVGRKTARPTSGQHPPARRGSFLKTCARIPGRRVASNLTDNMTFWRIRVGVTALFIQFVTWFVILVVEYRSQRFFGG